MTARTVPREGLYLALILALFAVLRGGYLMERHAEPDLNHPEIDAGFHDDWARTLAFGEERSSEWRRGDRRDPLTAEPYLRPPGYPWFLALIYKLTGGSALAAVIAGQLLGLGTVLLGWWLARRSFGALAGLVTAGALTLSWTGVFFEGELHAPALLGLLELASIAALLAARSGKWQRSLIAGLAIGATALVRPNALIFVPVAIFWLVRVLRRRELSVGPACGALVAGVILAISPATLRNWNESEQFVPITANLGINLYLGNHENANGLISSDLGELGGFRTCYDYPAVVERLERELGRELTLSQVSAHFGSLARSWIFSNPGAFLAVTARKAGYLVGPAEIGHNKVVSVEKSESPWLRFLPAPFPVWMALAILGFFVARKGSDEDREVAWLFGALALAFALSLLPFFAAARYRAPLVPLLAPLVGVACAGLTRARIASAAGIAALCFAIGPAGESGKDTKFHLDRAQAFFANGDFDQAREEFDAAIALLPGGDAEVEVGYGDLEQKVGNLPAAQERYRNALALVPNHPIANYSLALLEAPTDLASAMRRWQIAADADPTFAWPYYQLGQAYAGRNQHPEARTAFEAGLQRQELPELLHSSALLLSTSSVDAVRNGTLALQRADRALALRPGDPQARFARAAALAELQRFEDALTEAQALLKDAHPSNHPRIQGAISRYSARQPMRY